MAEFPSHNYVMLADDNAVSPLQSIIIQAPHGGTWAIKITKDGIVSNPDVPTDAGAKAMFDALEPYVRALIEQAKGPAVSSEAL